MWPGHSLLEGVRGQFLRVSLFLLLWLLWIEHGSLGFAACAYLWQDFSAVSFKLSGGLPTFLSFLTG